VRLLLDTHTLFDRLIAATALVEGMTLVSADTAFDTYGVTRLW
jgi:PIN domain nuclease of toxin-antitoxin system